MRSATNTPLPDGVRLVLSLPPGPALAGLLTRDWVRPTASVAKILMKPPARTRIDDAPAARRC